MAATLVCSGKDLRYTILPYSRSLDESVEQQLLTHSSDYVLGYITYNQETDEFKFTYTESGRFVQDNAHWSLSIMKEFPCCEENGPWIVYSCSPEKTSLEFGKILSKYSETLHIYGWDTWSVVSKDAKVAFITSWEIY
jgi:hypothetical protein